MVGNSVGGTPAFVGREDIIAKVEATLLQPLEPGIVLFGQRRIGKTSILQELRARLARRGPWTPIFFDLQVRTQASVDDIIRDLAHAIARARQLPEPTFRRHVTGEFRGEWLPNALATLEENDRIVLLFDEFDVVADPKAQLSNRRLFEFLRSLFDGEFRQNVAAVFAMGRTMEDLDISAGPLFRGIRTEHVSTLQRPDFDKLLIQAEQGGTIEWTVEAREAIWGLTAGHPMLTQLLASSVWQAANQDDCSRIERKHIADAVSGVLMESRNILGWLWDGLTPACRVVASSLAEHGTSPVSMDELEQILRQSGVRIMMGQLTEAPARLRDWDLLEAEAGNPGKFRFKVEILRQWITQHRPFASVREYLDRLNPEADDYYNRALDRWNSNRSPGDTTVVIRLLELVLNDPKGNPNHVGATELLAEVYLAEERLEDAIQVVARLLPSQTAALRPRYIYLLLLKVESLKGDETEEKRLQILDRILELAPGTAEAITATHAIWRDRGRRAVQAGRLLEARDCLRKSDNEALLAEVEEELACLQAREAFARIEALEGMERWQEALDLVDAHSTVLRHIPGFDAEACKARLQEAQQKLRLFQRACEARDRGDSHEAIDCLRQVIFIDPSYSDASLQLAVLVGQSSPASRRSGDHQRAWILCALAGWSVAAAALLVNVDRIPDAIQFAEPDAIPARDAFPELPHISADRQTLPPQDNIVIDPPGNITDTKPPSYAANAEEVTAVPETNKENSAEPDGKMQPETATAPAARQAARQRRKDVTKRIPLAEAVVGLTAQVRSLCPLGIEESKGELSVRFDVSQESGLVTGVAVAQCTARLEDPQCLKSHADRLVSELNSVAFPAAKPVTHVFILENL